LVSGRYPAFVFGGGLGALLPVFHFHEVTREELEPKLRHLADNGYRSVTSGEIAAYVRGALRLPPRSVGLCFDDAWKSLATVAAPRARAVVAPAGRGGPRCGMRSRTSDGRRALLSPEAHANCLDLVARAGGASFFHRPGWRNRLNAIVAGASPAALESEETQA